MSKPKITDFKTVCTRLLVGEAQIYFERLKEEKEKAAPSFVIIFGPEEENSCTDGTFKSPSAVIVQMDGYQPWHEETMRVINERLSIQTDKPLSAQDFANMTLEQILAIAARTKTVSRPRKPKEESVENKEKKTKKKGEPQPKQEAASAEKNDEGEGEKNIVLSNEEIQDKPQIQEDEVQSA